MSYFIDLDGTVFDHGTDTFLPGAEDMLKKLKGLGACIFFCTNNPQLGERAELLKPYSTVFIPAPSPRIVINDSGAAVHHHAPGSTWSSKEIDVLTHINATAAYYTKY